jgi:hypothetical protein
MKLYANGCSFTQGHYDHTIVHSPDGDIKKDVKRDAHWSWPRRMKLSFDKVVNEGWCGGSNSRIIRRSIEFLSTVDTPSEWVVILQFTSPDRSEWYDNESGTWIGQLNHRAIFDDRSWNKEGIDRDFVAKKSDHNIKNRALVGSDLQNYFELLCQIIAFENVCAQLGITKILYGTMSTRTDLSQLYHMCKYPKTALYNEVNTETWNFFNSLAESDKQLLTALITKIPRSRYLTPMSHVTKGYEESEEDCHPNKAGHNIYAQYVLNELKTREMI